MHSCPIAKGIFQQLPITGLLKWNHSFPFAVLIKKNMYLSKIQLQFQAIIGLNDIKKEIEAINANSTAS